MRKLTALILFFCLLSASTPAVTHAIAHAVVSSLEHSHDGGADSHLHHGDQHHNPELCLLPPALTRRDAGAAASAGPAPAACSVLRLAEVPLLIFVSPGDGAFVPLSRPQFIPQLACIPPPLHA